jgi:tetratricopeptide (TPR) repeat protein
MKTRDAVLVAALVGALAVPAAAVGACRTGGADPAPAQAPADSLQAGIALFQQGEYAKAEAALRAATGPDASAYLAASLAKQKKYAEAEAPARAALEANPMHEVGLAALGESLVGQRKFDEAIDKMSDAIKRKADFAYAYFWRGQAYYGKKKADKMVEDFETFLKLAPKSPEAPIVRELLSKLG